MSLKTDEKLKIYFEGNLVDISLWRSIIKISLEVFLKTFFKNISFEDFFFKYFSEDFFLLFILLSHEFPYCTLGFTIPKGIARKLNFLELPLFPHIQRLTLPL